ncbi:MAG TPA: hypothetical protein VG457_12185 [Planctomycetota bacterium]|nr:hypothetical protein [Planctomycetota bacterium]
MPYPAAKSGIVYDFKLKKSLRFEVPKVHVAQGLLWCRETLVVKSVRRLSSTAFDAAAWRWDPLSNSLSPVFLESRGYPYDQFDLPVGLGLRLRLHFREPDGLTCWYMGERLCWYKETELREAKGAHEVRPESINVLDRSGELVADLPFRETPTRARVSKNRSLLLLVTGPHDDFGIRGRPRDLFEYSVFDLKTGSRRWRGSCGDLSGIPAFVGERVFSLHMVRRQPGEVPENPLTIALMSHGALESKEILRITLRPDELATRFSSSVNQDQMGLQLDGKSPRLLIIPLREDATLKDVMEIRP